MNNNYIGVDLDLFRQPKIQRLELKLGKAGVALYLQMYLKLAECQNEILEEDLPLLEREFFVKQETLNNVIYNFDLFLIKNGTIYSTIIADKLSAIKKLQKDKSRAGKLGAEKRWSDKQKNGTPNGSANDSAIADPLTENSNKRKEKEIKENNIDNLKEVLDFFNETHNKNLKSTVSWEDNFNYWRKAYSLEEIKKAITRLNHPNWWAKDNPSLELLFRTKNKAGKCNYLEQLLEIEEQLKEDVYRFTDDDKDLTNFKEEFDQAIAEKLAIFNKTNGTNHQLKF
jgi:hypothetical protein